MALDAGQKMAVIGNIVSAVGSLASAYHSEQQKKALIQQSRYDTAAAVLLMQQQIKGLQSDRIYNANIERTMNRLAIGATERDFARAGLSGATVEALKAAQRESMEADVQERSRQTREQVKLLQYQQLLTMQAGSRQRRALKAEGTAGIQAGIVGGASYGFSAVSEIGASKAGSSGGSMVSSFAGKGGGK